MRFLRVVAVGLTVVLGACAHSPIDDPSDPLEPVNRGIFKFNRVADRYVLRPVASGYTKVVPAKARRGVSNFFDNLFYPRTIVSDLLQGKLVQGSRDLARFTLNTTVGLLGFLDVATDLGLPKNDEDLGQTFGYWGVGEGWYLMLPLLGPSTNRDLVGRVGDLWTSPTMYMNDEAAIGLTVGSAIDTRAALLGADRLLDEQIDPYVFLRSIYRQRRQSLVYDGNPPEEEFDFSEDAAPEVTPAP